MQCPLEPLSYFHNTWRLTAEMAPYLLLGFLMAGLLRAFFTEDWVKRHLGQRGIGQIFKAVVIGIPLPLCSCGVIPVAAAIRKQGGRRGAVAAFTASTPQTGIDSIAATVGMLGWVFAGVRVLIAFLNGIVAGLVVERWGGRDPAEAPQPAAEPKPCCCCNHQPSASGHSPAAAPQLPPTDRRHPVANLQAGLRFGLVTLPKDLFGPLVLGLLLAGAIATLLPADFFANLPGGRFALYLAMTLVALPLYICSTGSIPLAFSFLAAGMSPGAVLIFLIAGPASTVATVTALGKIIGPRATIGYVLSIIFTAWVAALVVDGSGLALLVGQAVHPQHAPGIGLLRHMAGAALVGLLLFSRLPARR